ncbi:dnaJ homolog subfamily C member 24-like [Thrips palmi]|uniref:DnaJ homolog subfamily C member 24-like n=1 Tax=Thrips palmi TaxID=161013 RepID=A0A6P9A1D6_THRPL|nr:dnaJ homolog subfamily C member 24-like [Thrips palmi]XP_034251084.1 dnaJ homolog subfamily C member 24-like [Thrips palmi]
MENFYTLLGCQENASYDEIKKQYQDLIRLSHPDKTSASNKNNESFIQINEAWQTLRDPVKRKAYDAQLLAEHCANEFVLFATLTLSEMKVDSETYSYPCRCGSLYSVPKDECVNLTVDLYYQCSECSLAILIKAV